MTWQQEQEERGDETKEALPLTSSVSVNHMSSVHARDVEETKQKDVFRRMRKNMRLVRRKPRDLPMGNAA